MVFHIAPFIKAGLILPDLDFVRQTLHTHNEMCPVCMKQRNAVDMVWMPNTYPPTACCFWCVHKSEYAQDAGVSRCIADSEEYAKHILAQITPGKWLLARQEQKIRDLSRQSNAEYEVAKALQHNWNEGRCDGRYSSFVHFYRPDYLVQKYEKCVSSFRNKKLYFSRLGFTCRQCMRYSAFSLLKNKTAAQKDIKTRQRLVCEGMRYAIWLAGSFNMLGQIERSGSTDFPYTLDWHNWFTGDIETTENVEYNTFGAVLKEHVNLAHVEPTMPVEEVKGEVADVRRKRLIGFKNRK